jgi:O-antigen/teichoic acid export membrane protein
VGLTAGLATSLYFAAPWLITLVFGNGYAGALAPPRLLLPGAVAMSSFYIDYNTAAAQKRIGVLAKIGSVSVVVLVPFDVVGSPSGVPTGPRSPVRSSISGWPWLPAP